MGRGGGLLKTPPSAGGAAGSVRGAAERAGPAGCAVRAAVRGAGRRGRAAGMLAPLLGSAGSGWLLLGECSPSPPRVRGLSFSLPLSLVPGSFLSPQRVGTRSPPWHGGTGLNPPKRPLGPRFGSPWPSLLRDKGYSKLFKGRKQA